MEPVPLYGFKGSVWRNTMFEVGGATTVCTGMGAGVVLVVVKTDDCAVVCGAKAGATAD